MTIPIIDIFAGPGGLGEGFSALLNEKNERIFKIALSVEKDKYAHETLKLRSFFRYFPAGKVTPDYYSFVKGEITLAKLYERHPEAEKAADEEAWHATLGDGDGAVAHDEVDKRIEKALNGTKDWVLIGGPPCQAYSVVGRSRRQEKFLDEETDERVGLYKQYLRILAVHNPSVFVMENVKGLLSAKTAQNSIFSKILSDLSKPVETYQKDFGDKGKILNCPGYKIYSLVVKKRESLLAEYPEFEPTDFLIEAEKYGIPQTRHRVILLGVRNDIDVVPSTLRKEKEVPISKVLNGLPGLRGGLSRIEDTDEAWKRTIENIRNADFLQTMNEQVKQMMFQQLDNLKVSEFGTGKDYLKFENTLPDYKPEWYSDEKLEGVCNHASKMHMESDLLRYFFAACFARVKGFSPKLDDFPVALLPDHKNIKQGSKEQKFDDRFRVQLEDKPAKTITSHISKDGHYYIHPDPSQCRSFTVREAARIQTFPDNYYFCGPRTQQFHQVGNAVPPLLANKIAVIVNKVFRSFMIDKQCNYTNLDLNRPDGKISMEEQFYIG
ncbi:DNA (cytosine-5-)-methyltransferase [Cytophagaceae bacterium YF14B1]|uniref:DNA (cytosine-5-)-methyltransferase n=1 Tax=Xanthocytophaga flava TaxID=3048013 RepID=A0AAE3QUG0_9BACT|nr:DNA (cytosine-5-)-methyltransferase [Xanthocytophaga flavus]MDJ1483583.1 DNA (cytosine-5-)-methyltransferase [Xanthocytophaga flavus]